MPTKKILVVDDEQPTIDSLELLLSQDFTLLVARNGEDALKLIKEEPISLVFLDISLPIMDGFEVLTHIKKYDAQIPVVMLTADDRSKTAMKALELGAFHYLSKPYHKDDIFLIVRRVFETKVMQEEIISLRDDVERMSHDHDMIGQSAAIREIYETLGKVARTSTTLLLTGESGTGKELVAKAIHSQSARKNKRFKAINCGAIPEHLLESELFGHEKGAFTGANQKKIGKFEMSHGGTIFLDEISTMPMTLQVKLLRVLQEREIERIGGRAVIPIDVRIIAATNVSLKDLVDAGKFRQDLYYRLNVIHLHLPPLRHREGDAALLAKHFLAHFVKTFRKPIHGFSSEAMKLLTEYSWPGNIRELRNVVERATVISDGPLLEVAHFPIELSVPTETDLPEQGGGFPPLKSLMERYERNIILRVLERTKWNQTKAANLLGIHRNTLIAKLDSLDINVKALKQEKVNASQSTV